VAQLRDTHRVDVVCLAGYMKACLCKHTFSFSASRHLGFRGAAFQECHHTQIPA